jgi:hypothetical protein
MPQAFSKVLGVSIKAAGGTFIPCASNDEVLSAARVDIAI